MHDAHRQHYARAAAGPAPRWKVLGVLSAAVLLLHGALLGGLAGPLPGHVPPQIMALQVHTVPGSHASPEVGVASEVAPAGVAAPDAGAAVNTGADANADGDAAAGPETAGGPATHVWAREKPAQPIAQAAAGAALPSRVHAAAPVRERVQPAPRAQRVAIVQPRDGQFDADAPQAGPTPAAESAAQPNTLAMMNVTALERVVEQFPAEAALLTEPSTAVGPPLASTPGADSVTGMQLTLAAVNAPAATTTTATATTTTSTATSAAAEPTPIPRYRTEMPPAATLEYQIGRGLLRGSAELSWQPHGDRYEFRLEAFLAGITLLRQVSQGGFDADGLAPLRFTDKRVRRAEEAANFRRDRGQVTFSGRDARLALRAGTQDRLSWMIQLAAIAAADPALRRPGAQVVMQVVGVHADESIWVLRCGGVETVQTDQGPVEALSFARVPDGPYETSAQIWLDPKRHYLPVRATWRSGPNDEGMDMRLREAGK